MRKTNGFTVIELLIAIVLVGTLTVIFVLQKNTLDSTSRDDQRKTSINAMYYNLENFYYPQHKAYPDHINSGVLTAMDPELFKDPNGIRVGEEGSDFNYIPTNCGDGTCKSYTLRSTTERESDYIKSSIHQ